MVASAGWSAGDLPTKFSNQGSIANTRHNMTQSQAVGGPAGQVMNPYRNDYQDVCVYCHTPDSTNLPDTAPVWNRTMKPTAYTTYSMLRTSSMTQTTSQPGANSLQCLSCHDGQTAIDSVVVMPGGATQASQVTSQDNNFLNIWNNSSGPNPHLHLALDATGCLVCHSPTAGIPGVGAADFTAAALGTDLRNDHPIGVPYPAAYFEAADFKRPFSVSAGTIFFDGNGDGVIDSGDVRLYEDTGIPKVECGSCHDPHGVPSAGDGSIFKPTFLRVTNANSALCLTCHNK
jgi:hypothetical protein